MITQAELKEILHYDPETGVFTWIIRPNGRVPPGSVAGTFDSYGYRQIQIYGVSYLAHRLAFLYVEGEIPKEVDHENHMRDDNRWTNLLRSGRRENNVNRSMLKSNTSGRVGVSKDKRTGKWRAQIAFCGKRIYLGDFSLFEEAAEARESAEIKYGYHRNHGCQTKAI